MNKNILAISIAILSLASCKKESLEILQRPSDSDFLEGPAGSTADSLDISGSVRGSVDPNSSGYDLFQKKVHVSGNTTITTTVSKGGMDNQMQEEVIENNTKYWGLKNISGYPIPNHSLVSTTTIEYISVGGFIHVFEETSSKRVPVNSKDAALLTGSIVGVPDPVSAPRRQVKLIELDGNGLVSSIEYTVDKYTKKGISAGLESDLPLVKEVHTHTKMSDNKMKTTKIVKTFKNAKSSQTITYDLTWKNTFTHWIGGKAQVFKTKEWMLETIKTNGTLVARFNTKPDNYWGNLYRMPKSGDFWNDGMYQGIIPSVEELSGVMLTFSTLSGNKIGTTSVGAPDRLSYLRIMDTHIATFIKPGVSTFTY